MTAYHYQPTDDGGWTEPRFQHFYRPGARTGPALAACLDCGDAPTAPAFGARHELPAGAERCPDCSHPDHSGTSPNPFETFSCADCDELAQLGQYAPCQTITTRTYPAASRNPETWTGAEIPAGATDPHNLECATRCVINAYGGKCREIHGPCPECEELADELTAAYVAAVERNRDLYQLARIGAGVSRQMMQDEASTWRDCNHSNGPSDDRGRRTENAENHRRYRAERDARADRSPYPFELRRYPALLIARHERLHRDDPRRNGCCDQLDADLGYPDITGPSARSPLYQ